MNIIASKGLFTVFLFYNFCKISKFKIHFELKLSISEPFEQGK